MNEIMIGLIGLLGVVIGAVITAAVARLNSRAAIAAQRHGVESTAEAQRRTEVMQMIRWAGEQAISPDRATSRMGIAVLKQLAATGLARDSELGYLFAIMQAIPTVKEEEQEEYTVSDEEGGQE